MVASYFPKVQKILVKICFLKWRYKLYILCNIKFLTGLFHWSGLTLTSYVPLTFSSLVHAAMPVSLSLSILFSILSCCSFSSLSSLKPFLVLTPVAASSFLCCMAHMFLTMFPTLFFWKPQYLLNVSLQYAVSDVFSLLFYPLALEGKNTSLVGFDIKTTGSNCDILLYSIKTFTNSNFSPK